MLNTPFSPWPSFTQEEAGAVSNVLLSNRVNYWTGQECRSFEQEFAAWVGTAHAIALANGTLALDLALHGLEIGSMNGGLGSDEVVVAPRTFIASVSCVVNAGAIPVFADIDRDSGNICAATIAKVVTTNTKAIIVVHLAGWPCDMNPIMELANERGIKVIEDCAQAHGALYRGRSVGSIGHVGAWSFCQDKIMTTGGEGGMVTTDDRDVWSRMWSFKDHGKSYDAVHNRQHPPGFRWVHESMGTNWRMLEMQAVIGRIQLGKLAGWTAARTKHAATLRAALTLAAGGAGAIRMPEVRCQGCNGCATETGCRHAFYKFYAYVRPENLNVGWDRDRIVHEINQAGVPCYQGSASEVYLEKAFDSAPGRPSERLAAARELGETSIMFLVHPTLTDEEMALTGKVASNVLRSAMMRVAEPEKSAAE
jgi:dTDP-4-amino-4,6-dideoxygalactose transaminase